MTDKKLKLRDALFNKKVKHPDATIESAPKNNIAGNVTIEAQISHLERANREGKDRSGHKAWEVC
jgi:hypothetical protein